MSAKRTGPVALLMAGALVLGFLIPLNVTQAGSRGECTSALVDEPFRAPDGSLYEPGKLTICASRQYSPVSYLHATYVNGLPVGMLISRRGTSEGLNEGGKPFMMFRRDASGLLHLSGYASPAGDRMVTYRLDLARVNASRRVAAKEGSIGPAVGPSTLFLAARID